MSSLAARGNAIIQTQGVDLSASIGKLVTFAAGVPAVNASATVEAVGLILDANPVANDPNEAATILLLAEGGGVFYGLIDGGSAALSLGDTVMQAAGGGVTKSTGHGNARVDCGIIADPNGAVAGDTVAIAWFTPVVRS